MYKKIVIGLLITLIILAFPVRLFEVTDSLESIFKILKALIYISIIFFLLRREKFIKSVNFFYFPGKAVFKKIIPALCLLFLYTCFNLNKFIQDFQGYTCLLFITLIATFILAFAEEIFFRAYLFNLFKKEGFSSYKSVVIISLIFAGIHTVNAFRYADLWSIINLVVASICVGIILGSLFALTKNILIVSLYHFIINVPGALSSVILIKNETNDLPGVSSFADNLIGTLVFVLIISPVIMLSYYYLKLIKKENV